MIIRWIRFDRILFSDIIILRILWSVSSLRHVYDHSGILEEDLCVRSTYMYWISFLQYIYVDQHVIQYAYTTNAKQPYFCHFIKKRNGINTGMFYHAGFKYFKLEFCYTLVN